MTPIDATFAVGSALYVVLWVMGFLLAVALILAPLKLYGIHKELRWQSEEMRTQTRLLAEMANAPAVKPAP